MPFRPRHPRTLLAFAALLDASIGRIAELAAEAREFDRAEIHRPADVWDDNTLALFGAATAATATPDTPDPAPGRLALGPHLTATGAPDEPQGPGARPGAGGSRALAGCLQLQARRGRLPVWRH
ncbi:hypothetical protein [Kitasatospora phosalacinea]|uniref:hypothetical protein n=1 Tax=Kitasatospora phosalacinea TaxID=2065 RepID=UPI0005241A85|nr:hypothetical protein [Kitasatospora phosalacinea]